MSGGPAWLERWQSPEGLERARECLARLSEGQPLDDVAWGRVDGRLDLRGLGGPLPKRVDRREIEGMFVEQLVGSFHLQGISLQGLDLTGAHLESIRVMDSTFIDCIFDEARLQDWRLWRTRVSKSRFHRADLRRSQVGAWYEGAGNEFHHVDFSWADLRSISSTAATFVDCDFSNAKLANIDFGSSSFTRCRFAGLLREVIFHGSREAVPLENPMEDIDFTGARFNWVEFRRLNLDSVKLPTSPEHLVVHHYRCVLERAIAELGDDPAIRARVFLALLQRRLKWAGPQQDVGVFSSLDFEEPGEAEFAFDLLRDIEASCTHT